MEKKRIKLTESDLRNIIKNSVQRFITENVDELSPELAIRAYNKASDDKKKHPGRSKESPDPAIRAKRDRQMKTFGDYAANGINQELGDDDFLAIGDRGARRMMYANGKNSAYLTKDTDDLDSVKLYNDDYQEGDEPLTIGNLPDDERARVHDMFDKFKGYHDRAAELDENVVRMSQKDFEKFIKESVERVIKEIIK